MARFVLNVGPVARVLRDGQDVIVGGDGIAVARRPLMHGGQILQDLDVRHRVIGGRTQRIGGALVCGGRGRVVTQGKIGGTDVLLHGFAHGGEALQKGPVLWNRHVIAPQCRKCLGPQKSALRRQIGGRVTRRYGFGQQGVKHGQGLLRLVVGQVETRQQVERVQTCRSIQAAAVEQLGHQCARLGKLTVAVVGGSLRQLPGGRERHGG